MRHKLAPLDFSFEEGQADPTRLTAGNPIHCVVLGEHPDESGFQPVAPSCARGEYAGGVQGTEHVDLIPRRSA